MAIEGSNGFLFLSSDSNDVLQQTSGELRLTHEGLSQWEKLIDDLINHCNKAEIKVCNLIVPNKHSVYPQFLPESVSFSKNRFTHDLLDRINRNETKVLFPIEHLSSADENTYHKTDTHWNDRGALLVFGQIVRYLNLPSGWQKDIGFKKNWISGDLLSESKIQNRESIETIYFPNNFAQCIYKTFFKNIGHVEIWENANSFTSLKCVVFGNSFITPGFIELLSHYFKRIVFVFDLLYDLHLIKRESPDVVIHQYLERFMIKPPNCNQEIFGRSRAYIKYHEVFDLGAQKLNNLIEKGTKFEIADACLYASLRLAHIGQLEESIKQFKAALSIEENPEFYYIYGFCLNKLSYFFEAIAHLQTAVNMRPENVNYIAEYTHCLYKIGDIKKAEKNFEILTKLKKKYDNVDYKICIPGYTNS